MKNCVLSSDVLKYHHISFYRFYTGISYLITSVFREYRTVCFSLKIIWWIMILEHEWPVELMNIEVYSSLMVKLQWAHWLFSCLEYDNLQFEQTTVSSISSIIVLVINTPCYYRKEFSVNYVTRQKNVQMYLCWLQKRNWSSFWTKSRQTSIL